MFYDGLAIAVTLTGFIILFFSLKTLFRKGWFLGWIRGMLGFGLAAIAIVSALAAYDIYSYRQLLSEQSIATISFEQKGEQLFLATLVDEEGFEKHFDMSGDQWQLDAKIVKWSGFFAGFGIKPGYRLDRLSGRYYSLDDERSAARSVYSLAESKYGLDVWNWLKNSGSGAHWIDAVYGSAAFVPMEDGALYEVTLSQTGLIARPLNDPAKEAVSRWQ